MGRAGRAFLTMANMRRVRQSPIRIATKQAITVFQSSAVAALPTSTL